MQFPENIIPPAPGLPVAWHGVPVLVGDLAGVGDFRDTGGGVGLQPARIGGQGCAVTGGIRTVGLTCGEPLAFGPHPAKIGGHGSVGAVGFGFGAVVGGTTGAFVGGIAAGGTAGRVATVAGRAGGASCCLQPTTIAAATESANMNVSRFI